MSARFSTCDIISWSLTSESDIQFHFRSAESALLPSGEGQLCHHLSHGNGKVWPVHRLLAGEEKLIMKPSLSLIKSLFTLTSCSVSAAAGGLSRHTRNRLECGQLGTGEGDNISKMKKMYKRFYFSEDILLEREQPRRAPAGSVNRPSNKCHVFHSWKVSRDI